MEFLNLLDLHCVLFQNSVRSNLKKIAITKKHIPFFFFSFLIIVSFGKSNSTFDAGNTLTEAFDSKGIASEESPHHQINPSPNHQITPSRNHPITQSLKN